MSKGPASPQFPPLRGRLALVTGAASTMGLAATRALLEDGCTVAMVDFDRKRR